MIIEFAVVIGKLVVPACFVTVVALFVIAMKKYRARLLNKRIIEIQSNLSIISIICVDKYYVKAIMKDLSHMEDLIIYSKGDESIYIVIEDDGFYEEIKKYLHICDWNFIENFDRESNTHGFIFYQSLPSVILDNFIKDKNLQLEYMTYRQLPLD